MRLTPSTLSGDRPAQPGHILLYTVSALVFFALLGALKATILGEPGKQVLPVIVDGQTRYVRVAPGRLSAWTCQILPAYCAAGSVPAFSSPGDPFSRDPLASPALRIIRDGAVEVRAWISLRALADYVDQVKPEIWFIGSSRVERGIDITSIERLLRQDGYDWSVVNLAVPGGGIETSLGVVRHFAERAANPRFIVYPIATFELNESFPSPVLARYFMTGRDFATHLTETFWDKGLDLNSRYYLSNIRYSLLEAWDLPTIKDAREAMLYLPQGKWRTALERMRIVAPSGTAWEDLIGELDRPVKALDLQALLQSLPQRADPTLGDYRVGSQKRKDFSRLMQFCRSRGIEIVFVNTPVSSWQQSAVRGRPEERFNAFMQEAGKEWDFPWRPLSENEFGLADDDFIGVRKGREFLDPDHLNWQGAQKYSTSLYGSVLRPVFARQRGAD
jgi:hypothetical protein